MNTNALLEAVRHDERRGHLAVAHQLGYLLSSRANAQDLQALWKGLSARVPKSDEARGALEMLLAVLRAAESARQNNERQRPRAVLLKSSWQEVVDLLADGEVWQHAKLADRVGNKSKVTHVLDELEAEGLAEPVTNVGMAKNARFVRLTERGLSWAQTVQSASNVDDADPLRLIEQIDVSLPQVSEPVETFAVDQEVLRSAANLLSRLAASPRVTVTPQGALPVVEAAHKPRRGK